MSLLEKARVNSLSVFRLRGLFLDCSMSFIQNEAEKMSNLCMIAGTEDESDRSTHAIRLIKSGC